MSNSISDDDIDRIRAAILAGQKIEAIKLYRQASGQGLKETKEFIEALEKGLHGGQPPRGSLSDDDVEQIRAAIFAGEKVAAIKIYRKATGEGILEGKHFVEALEADLRRTDPTRFTAPPREGCSVTNMILLAILAILIAVGIWAIGR